MKPSLFISLVLGLAVSVPVARGDDAVKAAPVEVKKTELPPGWSVPSKETKAPDIKGMLDQVEVKPENKNRKLEYLQEMQRRIDAEKAQLAAEREAQLRALEIQAQQDAEFRAQVDARIAEQARVEQAKKDAERMERLEKQRVEALQDIADELVLLRMRLR